MTNIGLEIEGMTCERCAHHVRGALEAVPGADGAAVAHAEGRADVRVSKAVPPEKLVRAAENAVGSGGRRLDLSAMPAVIFTDPQLAWVGLTEAAATARGEEAEVRTLSMEHVPRALANRDTRGRIKLVARKDDGRLLGVHVLSPQAGEVVQTGVLALAGGLAVQALADTLFPYLTEVEGLKLAAQAFSREIEKLSCCAG